MNVRLLTVYLCLSLGYGEVQAQLSDNFSDGDFSSQPTWVGNTSHFIVNALGQLQLNQRTAGTSYLSVASVPPTANTGTLEWTFYIRLAFAASRNNYVRVYLASDQEALNAPLNGYYLQFGENGANDAIELFLQQGATRKSVCRGISGNIAEPFEANIRVTRSTAGFWEIAADYGGKQNYAIEATGTDASPIAAERFGVFCAYTVTNAANMFLDDVRINLIEEEDHTPPTVMDVQAKNQSTISVVFSESVDRASAEVLENYQLQPSVGQWYRAALSTDEKTVEITFSQPLVNGQGYVLAIANITDKNRNALVSKTHTVRYFRPDVAAYKDVIFNECMPDPKPPVQLPEAEYIEILNRSGKTFDLKGWTLNHTYSTTTLPAQVCKPNDIFILTSTSQQPKFSRYGNAIGLPSFPPLANAGEWLVLKDENGVKIDSLYYAPSMYRDDEKKDGGWSLELIDAENICAEESNWTASVGELGGTPGQPNAAKAQKPDVEPPKLISAYTTSDTQCELVFNEKLDTDIGMAEFVFTPPTSIASVTWANKDYRKIIITTQTPLSPKQPYTLTYNNLRDCTGIAVASPDNKTTITLSEPAQPADVIFNEILFNPSSGGVDFVEIYNRSDKYINIKKWALASPKASSYTNIKIISTKHLTIPPLSYRVITSDPQIIRRQWINAPEEAFTQAELPPMPNDEGILALLDSTQREIDRVAYSEKQHSPFIKDTEGVSLERISTDTPTDYHSNWTSAASSQNYATPGESNSMRRQGESLSDDTISVEPEVFSPDMPGQSHTQILYRMEKGGYAANIKILDARGREVKTIAQQELLGTSGFFLWAGDTDDGGKVLQGYYLVWAEIFNETGIRKTLRKRIIIARN